VRDAALPGSSCGDPLTGAAGTAPRDVLAAAVPLVPVDEIQFTGAALDDILLDLWRGGA
jgi:hypothetical protein